MQKLEILLKECVAAQKKPHKIWELDALHFELVDTLGDYYYYGFMKDVSTFLETMNVAKVPPATLIRIIRYTSVAHSELGTSRDAFIEKSLPYLGRYKRAYNSYMNKIIRRE